MVETERLTRRYCREPFRFLSKAKTAALLPRRTPMHRKPDEKEPQEEVRAIPAAAGKLSGLLLSGAIGLAAFLVTRIQTDFPISPILLSIILGTTFRNLIGRPDALLPGIHFAQRKILRFAIVLLGLQLTFSQIGEVGLIGISIIAVSLLLCFVFTIILARFIGVEPRLAKLIGAGTAVCGVSAIMAVNTVTRAREDHVAYAVACITIFGTILMVLAPFLAEPLGLDQRDFGLWTGASLHEVAQVVAASFQLGEISGYHGTITKLSRVLMLAPLVIALGYLARGRNGGSDRTVQGPPMPWFILGFLAMVSVNSVAHIPAEARSWIALGTTTLFSISLSALGLETDIRQLRAGGFKPMALCAGSSLFIVVVSLLLIKLFPS